MPPKTTQQPNFLLKITLVKTTNPTVTRLISIPFDIHFAELHLAIAAAFGWEDVCTAWLFRTWSADPVQYCDRLKHKGSIAVYDTAPGVGFEVKPASLRVESKVEMHFRKEGNGKFWTYEYDIARFHHAIEVVDILNDEQKGTIGCLGGQGHIERKAWQFADLGGLQGVSVGAKSTWDLDMRRLNERLKVVQGAYEQRKGDEATKAAAKKKGPPEPKAPVLTLAKAVAVKPKGPASAKPPKGKPQPGSKAAAIRKHAPPTKHLPAKPKPAKATTVGNTAAKSIIPAPPAPPKVAPPTGPTPPKPLPSNAPNPTTIAQSTLPATTPSKARFRAATPAAPHKKPIQTNPPRTPIPSPITPIPSPLTPPTAAAPSRKRPLTAENQKLEQQAKKKARVVKSEVFVKEERGERKDVIRLDSESPEWMNVQGKRV